MLGLSPWELLLVFLAILLLFGAKRLPEIGSSLGSQGYTDGDHGRYFADPGDRTDRAC